MLLRTLIWKGKKKRKKKKDITIPIHTDSYILRTAFRTPLVADNPTSLPATVSDTLLCISSLLLFSFTDCFHLFPRLFCWEWSLSYSGIFRISLYCGIVVAHHLHPDAHTHTRTHNYFVHSFPSIALFISLFFILFFFSLYFQRNPRTLPRYRSTQPWRDSGWRTRSLSSFPPVNAFWFPPGLAYVIGRPSFSFYSPIGFVSSTVFFLFSLPRPILSSGRPQPPETGRSHWVRAGLSILHTFCPLTEYS